MARTNDHSQRTSSNPATSNAPVTKGENPPSELRIAGLVLACMWNCQQGKLSSVLHMKGEAEFQAGIVNRAVLSDVYLLISLPLGNALLLLQQLRLDTLGPRRNSFKHSLTLLPTNLPSAPGVVSAWKCAQATVQHTRQAVPCPTTEPDLAVTCCRRSLRFPLLPPQVKGFLMQMLI